MQHTTIADSNKKVHTFDNGIMIHDHHILDLQRERYKVRNVHEKEEEDLFVRIIKTLPEDPVFFNIGTAVGYYPILANSLRADLQMFCFEPLPMHIDFINENFELNKVSADNITIVDAAVSGTDGTVKFHDDSYASSIVQDPVTEFRPNSIYYIKKILNALKLSSFDLDVYYHTTGKKNYDESRFIEVKTMPLSTATLLSPAAIDFLQMDIQGSEFIALQEYFNAIDKRIIKALLIGTHGEALHNKCLDLLRNNGFEIKHNEENPPNQPDGIIYAALAAR